MRIVVLWAFLSVAAIATASLPHIVHAAPHAPALVLNGTTIVLDRPPIERDGRVFVPLRGVFEGLGASVVSNAGEITATSGTHTIALRVGAATASVDGVAVLLDDPPLLDGGRTFVPLRFVAQALGATVNFDESTRIVTVTQSYHPAPSPPPFPERTAFPALPVATSLAASPRSAATGGPLIVLRLLRLEPASDTTVASKRPEISATFSESIDPRNARVSLDGRDVTAESFVSERGFAYDPSFDLTPAPHDIAIDGQTPARESFHEHWSFTTTQPGSSNYLGGLEPSNGAIAGGAVVEISGFTRPKSRLRIIATTSETIPTFSAATEGSSTSDAVANRKGYFSAMLPVVDRGSGLLDVRVASTAPDGTVAVRTLRLRR